MNRGNMSAVLPFWAIDEQFLPRQLDDNGEVEIFNTKTLMAARVTLAGDEFATAKFLASTAPFLVSIYSWPTPSAPKPARHFPQARRPMFSAITPYHPASTLLCRWQRARVRLRQDRHLAIRDLRNDETFFQALKSLWVQAA